MSEMDDVTNITVDAIIENIPISFFHHRLLIICGLSFMADSMEVSLLSFISSCSGDEFQLTNNKKASLVSIVFIGELLGSIIWGFVADKYGRKLSFLLACFIISLCGIFSAFAPSYIWLLVLRFLVGFGVGGGMFIILYYIIFLF